ncbi:MAG: PAS domain-containing protein [Methanomicrobiales archaeon]|nr:PAS domain-containing protein [Methanomicrobiales archaeon]MDD1679959.1 PAS domain-containing protein [Methanomicrobiales archaeon]
MVSAKELNTDFDLIKKILRQNPRGMTVTEVARTVNRTKNTVGRYLDILHASGQVEMRTFGMAKVFTLSQRIPLSQVFSHAEERVMILDKDLRILQINQPFLQFIGKTKEEVLGKNLLYLPVADPGIQDLFSYLIESLEKPGLNDVVPIHVREDFFFRIKTIPIVFEDGGIGYTVILIDVTEVKRAMSALTESERKYRELVEHANSIILKMDTEGNITFFNEFAERFFGFSKQEILGKNVVGTIVPAAESSGRDLIELIHRICTSTEQYQNNENENITRDGRRVWIRWTNSPIRDEKGDPVGALSVGNDISERKQMEEELRKERDFINTTLHVLDALVIVLDRNGRVIRFNHACENLTGYIEEEVTGKPLDMFLFPEETSGVKSVFAALLSGKSPQKYRNHWRGRDGSPKLIEWSNSVLTDPKGSVTYVIGTGIDLTRFEIRDAR